MLCEIKQIDPHLSAVIAMAVRHDNVKIKGQNKSAALVIGKKWAIGQTINIGFMNGDDKQQGMVKDVSSEWLDYANLKFDWVKDNNDSMVRVHFGGQGSYSYIGTDCLGADKQQLTINFGWLDKSVIAHEFGHMLGLLHSHESHNFPYHFNEDVVIKDLSGPPNNWDLNTIRFNVLNKTTDPDVETPWEAKGLMNYYCKKEWIKEGVEVQPGDAIGEGEKALMRQIYPKGDNKEKIVTVGQRIVGTLPDSFSLITTRPGLFNLAYHGISKVLINGRESGYLIPLGIGKQSINLEGTGQYDLIIRKW